MIWISAAAAAPCVLGQPYAVPAPAAFSTLPEEQVAAYERAHEGAFDLSFAPPGTEGIARYEETWHIVSELRESNDGSPGGWGLVASAAAVALNRVYEVDIAEPWDELAEWNCSRLLDDSVGIRRLVREAVEQADGAPVPTRSPILSTDGTELLPGDDEIVMRSKRRALPRRLAELLPEEARSMDRSRSASSVVVIRGSEAHPFSKKSPPKLQETSKRCTRGSKTLVEADHATRDGVFLVGSPDRGYAPCWAPRDDQWLEGDWYVWYARSDDWQEPTSVEWRRGEHGWRLTLGESTDLPWGREYHLVDHFGRPSLVGISDNPTFAHLFSVRGDMLMVYPRGPFAPYLFTRTPEVPAWAADLIAEGDWR